MRRWRPLPLPLLPEREGHRARPDAGRPAPAAHDEPALYLPIFRGTYTNADAICYHTIAERRLVQRIHPVADRPQIVLGLGVSDPAGNGRRGGAVLGIGERPYVVSVGRVDSHKGSVMLASFFATYKERHPGPLCLALVGPVSAEIPEHPDIVVTGILDEGDKWDVVRDAKVSISPSALESFSLVVLEAWQESLPVMVNAACDPTREHCERSGGGCGSAPTASSKRSWSGCSTTTICATCSAGVAARMSIATTSGPSSSAAMPSSSAR